MAPVAPGSKGTVEMSPTGININKKQMNLRRGLLSINQAARPLTANTVQVGPGQTFSWPPPGLIPRRPPPPPPGPFLSHSGTNSGPEGGAVRFRRPSRLRGIWRFPCLQVPKGRSGPARTPACRNPGPAGLASQVPGAAPAGGCALQPLPALAAPLVWWTPSGIFNWKLIS